MRFGPDSSGNGGWVFACTGASGARGVKGHPLCLTCGNHVLHSLPDDILGEVVARLKGPLENCVYWVGPPAKGAHVFLKGPWSLRPRKQVDESGNMFGFFVGMILSCVDVPVFLFGGRRGRSEVDDVLFPSCCWFGSRSGGGHLGRRVWLGSRDQRVVLDSGLPLSTFVVFVAFASLAGLPLASFGVF